MHMKPGEIYVAHTPGDEHTDGHRFRIVREARSADGPAWLTVDEADGSERYWLPVHFEGKVLVKGK
jgi:hypothetical protein